MHYSIRCSCGRLQGTLSRSGGAYRCVCYCTDCQAFARCLQRGGDILDSAGGTEIIEVNPGRIRLTEGADNLACIRLTEAGLLRRYAACCNTPIGNTPANFKLSIVGLMHNCISREAGSWGEAFGRVHGYLHTRSAIGEPKPKAVGLAAGMPRLIAILAGARLTGSYKHSPFFLAASGAPVVAPRVLNNEELSEVKHTAANAGRLQP